ncbi:MAG: ATP synthase F1 subunit gamma [Clostridia bacterium]|nr:ATP synthase F1 subunit gamma [Clostridia bacterium]
MAGASINDIKARMKSVQSTMQITKAMELVATSKLRKARERVEASRPYYEILSSAIQDIKSSSEIKDSPWFCDDKSGKTLIVMIAGDRGLAGGYNSNIFRTAEALVAGSDAIFLPIGKKAVEYCRHRGYELLTQSGEVAAEVGVGDAFGMAELICEAYMSGKVSKVVLVYTKFVSMISQLPVYEDLLPLCDCGERKCTLDPLFEEDAEAMLESLVPNYVGGILYSATSEALASEVAARRGAMNAANKNAEEMISTLMLKFNRARQAVITQEITEIVSGAEAL